MYPFLGSHPQRKLPSQELACLWFSSSPNPALLVPYEFPRLIKDGFVGSLSLPWFSLPLQVWSCAWYLLNFPFGFCWLWKASPYLPMGSYPSVLSSVTAVKRKVASVPIRVTSVNQFVPAVDACDWGTSVLTLIPLLLFSFKAYQAFISITVPMQLLSRSAVTSMFPSPMASSWPSSYVACQLHLTQSVAFSSSECFPHLPSGHHMPGSSFLVPLLVLSHLFDL